MIRRRRPEPTSHSKTSQDRWLVSYADLVTLLFGFFVVMYSVSHVSEQKYRQLTETLSTAFAGAAASNPTPSPTYEDARDTGVTSSTGDAWLARLEGVFDKEEVQPWVRVQANDQWVEIDIRSQMLFTSGSAAPSAEAVVVLRELAATIAPDTPMVEVAGHTDDQPINNRSFASNWELSAARAAAVARVLSEAGIDPARLSAVGFGQYRPVADNTSAEGRSRNRRVVVRVARAVPVDPPQIPQSTTEFVPPSAPVAEPAAPADVEPKPLAPRRLPSGGLLFTNDPDEKPRAQ